MFAGIGTESPTIPYVVFNITMTNDFEYMSKKRGIDIHLVTFDVFHRTPSDCGDILDRLWNAFEGDLEFDSLKFIKADRTIYQAPNIEPDEQDGQHVWHGIVGFDISVEVDY